MKILEIEQGSPEWHQARCGLPTASCFDKIIDATGKQSKSRKKYLYQLAGERITGKAEETYQNGAMLRGKEMEGEARELYELVTGETVQQVGLCLADGKFQYGASPDGLVGEDGGLEIKCPLIVNAVTYLIDGKLPSDYFQQVQGQLLVTGRKWVDFLSYYPGMKPLLIRILPDPEFQQLLKAELESFCKELDLIVETIK